jgi:hypothetical protein
VKGEKVLRRAPDVVLDLLKVPVAKPAGGRPYHVTDLDLMLPNHRVALFKVLYNLREKVISLA